MPQITSSFNRQVYCNMGDCRISVQIFKKCFSDSTGQSHNIANTFSADTTIREVVVKWLWPLLGVSELQDLSSIWDCTLHPPKNITDWPTILYPAESGPKSKTLFDAGWFPSGMWQILPRGISPKISSIAEDCQYNMQEVSLPLLTSNVQFADSSQQGMKPSQLLHSIETRFDADSDPFIDSDMAMQARRQMKIQQKQKEAKKHAALEAQIAKLKNSNQSTTTLQVRKMLTKSRCTGLVSLRPQDRVYLHIVVVNGDSTTEDFRFFSTQDSVARITSTMSPKGVPSELLVKYKGRYRRLPVSTRLYEAITDGIIYEVDSILIRVYNRDNDEPTSSVLDPDDNDEVNDSPTTMSEENKVRETTIDNTDNEAIPCVVDHANVDFSPVDLGLLQSLLTNDHVDKYSKKKKVSATSIKVKQMLLKSKAKGDKKRIPKMDDRFYFEILMLGGAGSYFMHRKDSLRRFIKDYLTTKHGIRAFVRSEMLQFLVLPLDVLFEQADQQGLLDNFGLIFILTDE